MLLNADANSPFVVKLTGTGGTPAWVIPLISGVFILMGVWLTQRRTTKLERERQGREDDRETERLEREDAREDERLNREAEREERRLEREDRHRFDADVRKYCADFALAMHNCYTEVMNGKACTVDEPEIQHARQMLTLVAPQQFLSAMQFWLMALAHFNSTYNALEPGQDNPSRQMFIDAEAAFMDTVRTHYGLEELKKDGC